jgi:hypothetical protein
VPDFHSGAIGLPGSFTEGLFLRRSHPYRGINFFMLWAEAMEKEYAAPFASVNTIPMRVVSAATTNGPTSFRKLSSSDSAAFYSWDLFSSLGISDVHLGKLDLCLADVICHHGSS